MTTLKDTATAYEPKTTKNIADLDSFDISEPVDMKTGTGKDGVDFEYFVLTRDAQEYRIPNGVMGDLKNIIAVNEQHGKDVSTFAVTKTGEGMQSKYSVVTL